MSDIYIYIALIYLYLYIYIYIQSSVITKNFCLITHIKYFYCVATKRGRLLISKSTQFYRHLMFLFILCEKTVPSALFCSTRVSLLGLWRCYCFVRMRRLFLIFPRKWYINNCLRTLYIILLSYPKPKKHYAFEQKKTCNFTALTMINNKLSELKLKITLFVCVGVNARYILCKWAHYIIIPDASEVWNMIYFFLYIDCFLVYIYIVANIKILLIIVDKSNDRKQQKFLLAKFSTKCICIYI